MQWFRWHHGSVTDAKFQLVARKSGASVAEVVAVWAWLLEAASSADDRGHIGSPDFEALDCAMGLEIGLCEKIFNTMTDRGLIDAEGRVAAWDKRQPKRERDENSNERVRKFRANFDNVTPCNAKEDHVTPCNASDSHVTPRGEERREEEIQPKNAGAGEVAVEKTAEEVGREMLAAPKATEAGFLDATWRFHLRGIQSEKCRDARDYLAQLLATGWTVAELDAEIKSKTRDHTEPPWEFKNRLVRERKAKNGTGTADNRRGGSIARIPVSQRTLERERKLAADAAKNAPPATGISGEAGAAPPAKPPSRAGPSGPGGDPGVP